MILDLTEDIVKKWCEKNGIGYVYIKGKVICKEE